MSEPIGTTIKPMHMYAPGELAVAFNRQKPPLWKARAFASVKGGKMDGVSFKRKSSLHCMGYTVQMHVADLSLTITPWRSEGHLYQFINSAQKALWEILYYLSKVDDAAFPDLPSDYEVLALTWQRINGVNHIAVADTLIRKAPDIFDLL